MAHPIENVMRTTMENLKDMIDVNTVIGEPVLSGDGITIIPISKVSFGFVAGGGEYGLSDMCKVPPAAAEGMPFAGGTGAGVSVHPVGFLVVGNGHVRMLPANFNTPLDRIVEMVPQLVCDVRDMINSKQKTSSPDATIPEGYPPYGL